MLPQSVIWSQFKLDGDTNDAIEVVIQDDLTSITKFNIIAQGHVVTD